MKIAPMFAAAGLIIAGLVSSTAADAQSYRDRGGYSDGRGYRDDHRYDRRDYRRDNGRHYGWRNGRGHRDRCHVEFRHHRRVTVCG
ncbi:MAG: hypothetical protein EOP68_23015 [Sphingomonas sp.]|nr:MAG: hypothetical protein EOP68_23015 [Sphingomonas sp.]